MKIDKTQAHLFIGEMVRVVYDNSPIHSGGLTIDHLITPPVQLKNFNPSTNEATIQRSTTQKTEIIKVYELFKA